MSWAASAFILLHLLTPQGTAGKAGIRPNASFFPKLIESAIKQTESKVTYDGAYRQIPYPGGDVPPEVGVCTDVLVRAYRKVGIDLQVKVHEDMAAHFSAYPSKWGLKQPDTNIDHRRVPNLQVFFHRRKAELPVSDKASDYAPGDLVTWTLPKNLPHIGIVTDRKDPASKRPLIVHNIGKGPQLEDMLFAFPITGHYRYWGQ